MKEEFLSRASFKSGTAAASDGGCSALFSVVADASFRSRRRYYFSASSTLFGAAK